MQEIKRGEIWLVNLDPAIGHEIKKSRPALIIQNDIGNKYSPITIIAPLTSQNIENVYPVEVFISKNISKLDKDSKILLNQIRAIDKKRLVKKLSRINQGTMEKVNEALNISLELINID